ncbi:nucleoside deaminase [uncultured Nitratireductor sp.]|uniref:nucleoside deaminase n=1 Tax=uncultured Nitratireductor sp. TaxID=520953 RepID=UPI0025E3C04B|nr:nucleoside deaminase [uncultured Nitratireductor sp.]
MVAEPSARLARLMEEAVAFSVNHVHEGGIPFTALVVDRRGIVLGRGVNRVRELLDPTAHAEVEAIRDACRMHGKTDLRGATLLASGEPCAMCYMSALFAGISHVLFAADRDEAAAHGFDYRDSYRVFAQDPITWRSPSAKKFPVPGRLHPFLEFGAKLRFP